MKHAGDTHTGDRAVTSRVTAPSPPLPYNKIRSTISRDQEDERRHVCEVSRRSPKDPIDGVPI